MARKRMVHADLFTSETVARLSLSARYTWVGILTYLDDYGRGKNHPALVKAAVWPLDEVTFAEVRDDLDALIREGMLCDYQCCETAWFHSPRWTDYQQISHPAKGRQCPCPEHEPEAHELFHAVTGRSPEKLRKVSGNAPRSVVELRGVQRSSEDDPVPFPEDFREQFEQHRLQAVES